MGDFEENDITAAVIDRFLQTTRPRRCSGSRAASLLLLPQLGARHTDHRLILSAL
jgi:hypothetical protein